MKKKLKIITNIKIMKELKKEDLIEGEIYFRKNNNTESLFIFQKNKQNCVKYCLFITENNLKKTWSLIYYDNLRLATPEEKHWLETCIQQDKYVSYEEAMKTFIPEYVECIRSSTNGFTENKIYKIEKNWNDNINFQLIDNDSSNRNVIMNGGLWSFKPSTKEAYDAQFELKELPEKWCIRWGSKENFKIINDYLQTIKKEHLEYTKEDIHSQAYVTFQNKYFGAIGQPPNGYTEITFEQFKKWVLKEEIKSPIQLANEQHPELAINEPDWTMNVKEPIVEESLLDKAKRLYPIGTTFFAARGSNPRNKYTVTQYSKFREYDNDAICIESYGNGTVYFKKEWAQIISKPEQKSKEFEILSIRNKNTKDIFNLQKDGYYRTEDGRGSVFLPKEEPFPFYYEIMEVSNKEGNIFIVGDDVQSIKSKVKSKISTFKMSKDNQAILACTTRSVNFGIGINHLEHYTEPKKKIDLMVNILYVKRNDSMWVKDKSKVDYNPNHVEFPKVEIPLPERKFETNLEKAKRLYPIGTVVKTASFNSIHVIKKTNPYIGSCNCIYMNIGNTSIYDPRKSDKWADIIGYEPQVGDKFELLGNSIKQEEPFIIDKFVGSWDNPNSVIHFIYGNYGGYISNQTVLLKNIKIVK